MQKNKHGIPVQQKTTQPRKRGKVKPQFKLEQRTLITVVNGVEVSAVLPNFSPVINLLKESGWREVSWS